MAIERVHTPGRTRGFMAYVKLFLTRQPTLVWNDLHFACVNEWLQIRTQRIFCWLHDSNLAELFEKRLQCVSIQAVSEHIFYRDTTRSLFQREMTHVRQNES